MSRGIPAQRSIDVFMLHLRRVMLRLWNDAEWQRTERERHDREMLELARRLLEWNGRAEEFPRR